MYRRAFCDCPNCMEHGGHWPVPYVAILTTTKWHRGKRKRKRENYSFECYLERKAELRKPEVEQVVQQGKYRAVARADDPAFPAMVDGCPGCDGYGMRPRGKTYCLECAHRLGIDVAAELAEEIEIAETTEEVGQFAAAMGMIRYYGLRVEHRRTFQHPYPILK